MGKQLNLFKNGDVELNELYNILLLIEYLIENKGSDRAMGYIDLLKHNILVAQIDITKMKEIISMELYEHEWDNILSQYKKDKEHIQNLLGAQPASTE